MEQLVLWHRVVPPGRDVPLDAVAASRWTESVAAAWVRAGGSTLAVLGGSVVASFPLEAVGDAITTSLGLLDEAERNDPPTLISIGVAFGEVDAGALPQGSVIDRAALIAHRIRAGELAFDPAASELTGARFLFGRSVGVGAQVDWRASCIDRIYPERSLCLPQIRYLGGFRMPNVVPDYVRALDEAASSDGTAWVVLRGRLGTGTEEWVEALANTHMVPLVLWVQAVPGALEPLGSLRFALLRTWGSATGILDSLGGTTAAETLAEIARGNPVTREDAIRAVQTLLNTFAEEGSRPWIVLHPFTSVDPASREVVALATLRAQVGSFVIANVPEDTALPKGLEQAIRADVTLVPLTGGQRLAASRALFGPTTEAEIIERVAALGDTPLGVLEAARMLIGRGDIVFHDDRFIWRHKPQHFAATVPVGALIEDRLSALAPVERRILEVVAVAPSGAPNELLWDIMTRDGVDGATALDAISHLRDGAFLQPDDPLQATSAVLRGVIFEATEPVRIAELQRLVAEALHASGIQGFPAGSLGFYLYESGDHANAARALLHAGAHASRAGFMRAAMRLAAAGVQFDPSPETRAEAASITQSMPPPGMPRTSASAPPSSRPAIEENQLSGANTLPPTGDLGRKAIDAILSGNFDAADHTIDVAIAEGCNPQAADRLRAMAHLVRGDVATAVQLLAQSKEGPAADDRARVRYGVAKTLVLLHSGRPLAAMRAGLRALGAARALDDLDGERAAMHAVASALEGMGRDDAAITVRDRAAGR